MCKPTTSSKTADAGTAPKRFHSVPGNRATSTSTSTSTMEWHNGSQPSESNNQSHHIISKSVRFRDSISVLCISTHREYSTEERSRTWYSTDDYESFQDSRRRRSQAQVQKRQRSNADGNIIAHYIANSNCNGNGNGMMRRVRSFPIDPHQCEMRWSSGMGNMASSYHNGSSNASWNATDISKPRNSCKHRSNHCRSLTNQNHAFPILPVRK